MNIFSFFCCSKCHEILEKLQQVESDNERLEEKLNELVDRVGLRRVTYAELLANNMFESNPIMKFFRVKDKVKEKES